MFRKLAKANDGNISILLAVSATTLLIGVGAAIDLSSVQSESMKMQFATDSAALSAAIAMTNDTFLEDSERTNEARVTGLESFSANYTSPAVINQLANISIADNEVVATSEGDVKLNFGKFLGKSTVRISARSASGYSDETRAPCIIALSTSASPGILVNGGANIEGPGCETHVHSIGNPAFTVNSGVTFDFHRTCISGRTILNNNSGVERIETNCDVAADPYAGQIPIPSSANCDYSNANYSSANVTLSPGVYCGWYNFNNSNSEVVFEPGIYVLKNGGWNVNGGNWSGDGVTFYYADNSKIQFNNAVSANFKAPTSGPYAGIFMTETPSSSRSQFILNDALGFIFEGAIYLPNREFVMNSRSNTRSRNINIVADTIIFNSTSLAIGNETAASVSELSSVRLIE